MNNQLNTKEINQVLHSIFAEQHLNEMDWQKVPKEYKNGTEIFNHLSLDEVMFAATISRWPFDPNKQSAESIKELTKDVQNCVARSHNYLIFKEQFETLFCLAGGKKEEVQKFRRDWNKKNNEARNDIASNMMIGNHSLKHIIETLSFDQEHHFVCGENYALANEFLNSVRSWSSDTAVKSKLLGLGFIHYQGDTSSEKRPDINGDLRSVINLSIQDENNLWVEFNLEKDGIETTYQYNLLEPMKIQNDIYIMDPSFYKIRDTNCFIFSGQIVWLIDEEPEHFEFSVRYCGELPEYLNVGEMY